MRCLKQEYQHGPQANVSCKTSYVENSAKHTLHHTRNRPRCLVCLYLSELRQLKPGVPPDQREHRPHNRSIQCHEAPQLHHCGSFCYTASRCIKHILETNSAGILDGDRRTCHRAFQVPGRFGMRPWKPDVEHEPSRMEASPSASSPRTNGQGVAVTPDRTNVIVRMGVFMDSG